MLHVINEHHTIMSLWHYDILLPDKEPTSLSSMIYLTINELMLILHVTGLITAKDMLLNLLEIKVALVVNHVGQCYFRKIYYPMHILIMCVTQI